MRVEVVDQRVRGHDAVARGVPPDDLLVRVHLAVEIRHGAVELHVHEHLPVLLVVRHRVRVLHRDAPGRVHRAEQGADHAIARLLAADVAAGGRRRGGKGA